MRLQKTLALVCALGATPVLADSIDINLHDDAIRATYTGVMQRTRGLSGEVGLLYAEDKNNDSETLVHGGLLVSGENWSKSGTFDIAIGGRLLYASFDASPNNEELLALAFGGRVRFSPVPRLGIGGHFSYAPDITAFMDSEAYEEYGLRLDYQILPQAFVYLGYRKIEVDFGFPENVELDDNGHIGFKMAF